MNSRMKGIGHGPTEVAGPKVDMLPGWRAACAAYRNEWCKQSRDGGAMYRAAQAAFLEAVPNVSAEEASVEVTRAIYWASVEHNAWLFPREHLKRKKDPGGR